VVHAVKSVVIEAGVLAKPANWSARRARTESGRRSEPVIDALGRSLERGMAQRIVSLVPSETESVARLAGVDRLVGRTDYCEEPRGQIERIPTVGGTKKVDRAAVIALAPDLVLANKEESARSDGEALIAAGLRVHVSFPCTIAGSVDYLESLSMLLFGDAPSPIVADAREELASLRASQPQPLVRVFVPIWKDPWMSFDERAFASDVLAHAGLVNVFADRPRRYPLTADLGERPDLAIETEKDTRYPRFHLQEAISRVPEVVVLPDEPYRFGDVEAKEILAAAPHAGLRIAYADGKDLFWYGVRALGAPARLRRLVLAAR
jgi:ABC-type Fe3+-hydroxamate transport system substrate-binding protein